MSDIKPTTSTGLEVNVLNALAYAFGPLSGIILLIVESKNKEVKYNALQSTILFGLIFILWTFYGTIAALFPIDFISFCLTMFSCIIFLAVFFGWIFLIYKAYNKEKVVIPVLSDIVEKLLAKQ